VGNFEQLETALTVEASNTNTDQLWLSLGGTKIDDRKPKPETFCWI
jgi:hypothetical protein